MSILYYTQTYETTPRRPRGVAKRNSVICIDGTGQDSLAEDPDAATSNVFRLFQAVTTTNNEQFKRYYPGVGSQENDDNAIRRAWGGITGAGARRIRLSAYLDFVQNYRLGDRIYIFGFSRGAAIARTLANHIAKHGVPEIVTAKFVRQLFRDDLLEEVTGKGKKHAVKIEMLGAWDTVAAFGNPTTSVNLFKNLSVAPNVKTAYHLMSIDENRQPFRASLMNYERRVHEIWFPGVHSDVGGGYADHQFADVALRFMMKRAAEHGLRFKRRLDDFKPDLNGTIHDHRRSKIPKEPRAIEVKGAKDRQPTIHKSALTPKRRPGRRDPTDYSPAPLVDLGGSYTVDERD